MAGDPNSNLPPPQPERDDSDPQAAWRIVTTQSGDYAEGDIDKRTSIVCSAPREAPPPAFQVPYQAIPLVGRTEALAELEALLSADAAVALSSAVAGMAGVGKTLLAATFARQHQAAFPGGIFWLNMEQPDQIAGQVAACAGPGGLDLLDFPALAFADRIVRVQAAWNSPLRRLLVFDNLEDPALLERWQPTGGGTQVLITSRRDAWPRQVRRLRLPVLPRPQSIELLLGARSADLDVPFAVLLADSAEHDAANAICNLLGDLPLALAISAALLRLNPSITLQHMCAQIAADPLFTDQADTMDLREALREAGLPTGRALGVVATFAISYRQLQADGAVDASALRMLHAAAYCAPAPIPQQMLWWVAEIDSTTEMGRAKGDAATRRLRALGFIASPALDSLGTITLHRLLAAFVRRQPHSLELLSETVAVACSFTHSMQEAGQIKLSLELVPHIETLLTTQTRTLGAEHPDTLSTTMGLANALYRQGDYAGARARYEAVLAVQTRTLGAEHPDTLSTTHNLATALSSQGDYAAARARYEAVLTVQTRTLGAEHPDTLSTTHNLANALDSQGDYAAARARYEAVLTVQTRTLGAEHPDTLSTTMGLANALSRQGDYAAARARYKAVLAVQTHTLGAEHPDTLATMMGLTNTLQRQGDYAAARTRYEAVLVVGTHTLGAEHPNTLGTMSNLANTLYSQGDYAAARTRFEAVLAVQTRTLGAEHPKTLGTMSNLANTLYSQGDYAAARARCEALLAIRTRTLGAEHPDTLATMSNLASMLYSQGDYAGARAHYEAVLVVETRTLGAEHPDTLATMSNLTNTLYSQGDYAAARVRYEAVLTVQTRTLGAEHPATLATTMGLATALYSQGDYAGARARYEAVLAVQTHILGAEHPATLATTHNLATVLESMGRWHTAAALRLHVFNAYEQRIRTEPLQSLNSLIVLNRNLGLRGYQRATRQRLKVWRNHLPSGRWRGIVQILLFVARTPAVITAILLGWIASNLAGYTGYGPLLSVVVVLIAVLSYWSRWALIALFGLASVALVAPLSSGLPAPWSQIYNALAALLGAMLVPYGAPAFAWLLSVTRLRLLAQPLQSRSDQRGRRMQAWSQAVAAQMEEDDHPA